MERATIEGGGELFDKPEFNEKEQLPVGECSRLHGPSQYVKRPLECFAFNGKDSLVLFAYKRKFRVFRPRSPNGFI